MSCEPMAYSDELLASPENRKKRALKDPSQTDLGYCLNSGSLAVLKTANLDRASNGDNSELLVRIGSQQIRLLVNRALHPGLCANKNLYSGVDTDGYLYTGLLRSYGGTATSDPYAGIFAKFEKPIPNDQAVVVDWWYNKSDGASSNILTPVLTVIPADGCVNIDPADFLQAGDQNGCYSTTTWVPNVQDPDASTLDRLKTWWDKRKGRHFGFNVGQSHVSNFGQ